MKKPNKTVVLHQHCNRNNCFGHAHPRDAKHSNAVTQADHDYTLFMEKTHLMPIRVRAKTVIEFYRGESNAL